VVELDLVDDLQGADDRRGDPLCLDPLVVPVRGPGQRDETVVDLHVDGARDEAVEHERLEDVGPQVGVVEPALV
jgi:hypothetical protein